jgi:hypothetical protein
MFSQIDLYVKSNIIFKWYKLLKHFMHIYKLFNMDNIVKITLFLVFDVLYLDICINIYYRVSGTFFKTLWQGV